MGSAADGLCTFGPAHDTRWPMSAPGHMTQMSVHGIPLNHTLNRQPTLGQSLSVSSGMGCNMNQNPSLSTGTTSYQSSYGNLNYIFEYKINSAIDCSVKLYSAT